MAAWCNAEYINKKVVRVEANKNLIHLADDTTVSYDIAVINVGSRTRDAQSVPGIWEHSLTTRPINDLLGNIVKKEEQLKKDGIIPEVVVIGQGAAGTELAFGYKKRWSDYFGQEIKVSIVSHTDSVLQGQPTTAINEVMSKLKKHNIAIIPNERVKEIKADRVVFESGNEAHCNVAVWATGAEAQELTFKSDLELLNGYFRVNDHLQSTSHPNVFAGGDCITIEKYADEKPIFPPKAGVYAVREGPIIAQNLCNVINGKPLVDYVPQRMFLSLLMTGDEEAIANKHGIAFSGKWVWRMKDWIDRGFMKLFDPHYLFEDYANKGTAKRLANNELFDDEDKELQAMLAPIKERVKGMSAEEAGKQLSCDESETEFHERFQILMRMHTDPEYT